MNTQEIQIKYDILQTAILAAINIVVMTLAFIFAESMQYAGLLRVCSGVAIAVILAYLVLASLFVEACSTPDNPWINPLNMAAKTCQWLSMIISSAVIIFFIIT